jgi:hypothetical protein
MAKARLEMAFRAREWLVASRRRVALRGRQVRIHHDWPAALWARKQDALRLCTYRTSRKGQIGRADACVVRRLMRWR